MQYILKAGEREQECNLFFKRSFSFFHADGKNMQNIERFK